MQALYDLSNHGWDVQAPMLCPKETLQRSETLPVHIVTKAGNRDVVASPSMPDRRMRRASGILAKRGVMNCSMRA